MFTPFHLEVFSSGLKAKLDVKYRRIEGQRSEIIEFRKNSNPSSHETALPFTTKTRAYGTYVWRNSS
jgi:hypothetical protein